MNISTVIICVLLVIVCVFSIINYRKKLKNGCCGSGDTEVKIKPDDDNKSNYEYKFLLSIGGMTCEHCALRIENAYNRKQGCMAKVNLKKKSAELWTKQKISESEIREVLEGLGYLLLGCDVEK